MKRFVAFALVLAAALCCAGPVRAQAPALQTIRVGVLPAEVAGEIFYGIDEGFFRKAGLNVEIHSFSNGASIASAVASGSLDLGLSDMVSMISAHARGLPFVYVAPGLLHGETAPTYAIIVAKNGPIHEAKDFDGKTFGVNGLQNISQLGVEAWIDNNGGHSKTVRWVEVPFTLMAPSLAKGTIAGAAPNEPALTAAEESGDRVIVMSKNSIAPVYLLSGWLTTRAWADAHQDEARRFAQAMKEIAEWTNKNHAATARILAKYTKIPQPVAARMRRGDFATTFNPALMQPVIDAAAKYGIIPKAFPSTELVWQGR